MTDQSEYPQGSQFPAPIEQQAPNSGAPQQPTPYGDWREQRRAEREQWRSTTPHLHQGNSNAWIGGLILVAIGAILLAQNLVPGFYIHNWWALFILIPAIGALSNAWRQYRAAGRLTSSARSSLTGSMLLFFIAAIFLFGWSWGKLWPVFIILAGLGILLNNLGERK